MSRTRAALLAMSLLVSSLPVLADVPGDASPSTLRQQAEQGDAAAEVAFGRHLLDSQDPRDKAASADWFRKAAMQGNSDGQWMLGSAYMAGLGVARDQGQGLAWMRKSLADGSPEHMATYGLTLVALGVMTGQPGDGVAWLQRGADAGSTKGMLALGALRLSGGAGLDKDLPAAEQWFLRAANAGDAQAQATVGQMDIAGTFGHADAESGVRWLRTAAAQGDVQAQGALGYFLISGAKGVAKQPVEGVQWATKAAARQNAPGHYALGIAYQYGSGEPQDPAQAWYHFAVAGRLDAKHQLDKLADHMSEVATRLSADQLAALRSQAEQVPDANGAGQPAARL